jgi:hypothetical protein
MFDSPSYSPNSINIFRISILREKIEYYRACHTAQRPPEHVVENDQTRKGYPGYTGYLDAEFLWSRNVFPDVRAV